MRTRKYIPHFATDKTDSLSKGTTSFRSREDDSKDPKHNCPSFGAAHTYPTRYTGDGLSLPTSGSAKEEAAQEAPDCLVKYFSVVWCKASKKKHKKWEGDAILITKGKSVILKDMEGKDIGRGTGYKAKELDGLDEGQTLMVGGKEIEVMSVISADDFSSGRCFQAGIGTHDTVPTALSQTNMKPFCKPFKNVCQPSSKDNMLKDSQSCKPRHDPNAPNSLVMPRPNASHQWAFNKAGLPVVDVVVDPYIANNLRPHQKEGIIFLYECIMGIRVSGRFGAILADEMGLGKTLQCIALVWTLLRQGPYGCKPVLKRALIVTPGSLVKNWKKEFQKWLGSERIKVFTVDQDHKVEEFTGSPLYSVMIISYEMLLRSLDQVQAVEFNLLICDEGHRLKNSTIKTTTALTSLSCERRIILTGTPIQNDLQEFYALIEFVNPGILGSLSTYRKIYEEPIVRSREPSATKEEKELGEKRAAELTRLTGLFILRRTQEVINKFLPPKKESIIFCRPTALQLELYRKLLSSRVITSCLQGRLENSPHLICIGALKKLCNHPCLLLKAIKDKSCDPVSEEHDESSLYEGVIDVFPQDYTPDTFSETDSGKLQVLVKLLAAIRQPVSTHELAQQQLISPVVCHWHVGKPLFIMGVVLVSNYTQTLNILQETCKRCGYSYTRLDGNTPVSQRQQIVDTFNSKFSPAFIFLLSSKAGGVGLNLVGASHLILYDIDWNPATDIQAMARVWRDGQKHAVHIYRLLTTGSIEEKIYQRQISKQDLSGAVVDLSKTSEHIHFSIEELKNLFTLHEDSSCVTHDLLECNCMGKIDHQNKTTSTPPPGAHHVISIHPTKTYLLQPRQGRDQAAEFLSVLGADLVKVEKYLQQETVIQADAAEKLLEFKMTLNNVTMRRTHNSSLHQQQQRWSIPADGKNLLVQKDSNEYNPQKRYTISPDEYYRRSWSSESSDSVISSESGSNCYRVVLIGEHSVGKSSLANIFAGVHDSIDSDCEVLGEDTYERTLMVDGESATIILLDMWDNKREGEWIRDHCMQVGDAYLIVYSITDRASFEKASELRIQLRRARQKEDIPIILVGNKSDLVRCREVSVAEGRACAVVFDCKFIETSAAVQHNVKELFEGIVRQVRLRRDSKEKNEKRLALQKRRESIPKKARRFWGKIVAKNNKNMAFKLKSKSCHDLSVL
ncbi:DNA repair and recombination protein RAD54B [Pitangus sulphuratus]|nr:DNA repair and recombination protein RAD54B [Pitangus sulphuratus]